MTIDKAIEILDDTSKSAIALFDQDRKDALLLGIQALKRIGAYRQFPDRGPGELLPGEIEK